MCAPSLWVRGYDLLPSWPRSAKGYPDFFFVSAIAPFGCAGPRCLDAYCTSAVPGGSGSSRGAGTVDLIQGERHGGFCLTRGSFSAVVEE